MARLSASQRRSLPSKDFALSGRRFPIEDKAHAEAAERLAPRAEKAGSITAAQERKVISKAHKAFHRGTQSGSRKAK